MGTPLVIVESPAKARTIEKYLGGDFKVEASVGHIRDLPGRASEIPARYKKEKWARLGVDVDGDFKPLYVVPADKKPQVKKLKALLKDADELYLATDEDREGESISWHLHEVLQPKVPVRRLVFHEITREAIQRALQQPRDIDQDLVRAQEARRIVDRLYGYEVSPLLWKKIRPKLSAGRVQSVAVRLIVERERERMAFRPATWWDASGRFAGPQGAVDADLDCVGGQRIARGRDFGQDGRLKRKDVRVLDQQAAEALAAGLVGQPARVIAVEKKPTTDKPAPPFTTSTLQQEANRKLNWTARRTMTVAQHLYETGWITYMRTDSTTLSQEAIRAARDLIREQYGPEYLPSKPRIYKGKVKNAQEAHEAIRPAGSRFRTIAEAARELGADERRLYELIWKRTVASQMENARGFSTAVRIEVGEGELASIFEARGKTIAFPGYRRAYVEGADDPDEALADQERILPPLKEGDVLSTEAVTPREHTTKPPARLTEASLVKELERRGIGRPSTYASIIDTILRREYVFKKGSALVPTFTAFAVVHLLEEYLGWLVDYDFTARMEDRLDEIAVGQVDPLSYLRAFYQGSEGLHARLEEAAERIDPREVCTVTLGQDDDGNPIVVRVGRYGPYLERGEDRADVPDDIPPDELTVERAVELLNRKKDGPVELGVDPESGRMVYLMHGRFGPYVQLGEADGDGRPKRASLLRGMTPQDLDLDLALKLLSLPRSLGTDPDTGEEVIAANGRYGPYVKRGRTSRTVPAHLNVLEITLDEARTLLATAKARRGPEPLKDLGEDPSTGRAVKLMSGRYGPYVTDGETNASLPKDMDPLSIELDRAIELIRVREQAPKRPRRTTRKTAAKKTTAKKTTAKKTTAKKTTAKKTTAKKTTTKKTTAKKMAAKKTATKKTATKKTTTKKTAAKKTATRETGATPSATG